MPTRVPIVMYHAVQARPANAPYPGLFLRPALFASQMRFLARHRFHPITLDRLYAAWHGGASLPPKPIVLTFDDGFRSVYQFAVLVLRAHGWPAVLDLAVTHLHEGTWGLNRPEVMTMIRKGWELDSHTLTHQNLTALADAALRRETLGSRRLLRRLFGVPVRFLCYPAGEYDQRVIDAARAAGYIGGTTELPGPATPGEWFTLPRIRAPDGGGDALAQALAGALGPAATWR
ncbi:MAG: polysaccharide deacetylase family protein [Gaiellales bacterium]